MHDKQRHRDARHAPVRMERIAHQKADRHEPERRSRNVDGRCIRRLQDELSNAMFRGDGNRHARPQREAPRDDSFRCIARSGEGVSGRSVVQQPLLARHPARARIAAIGQGNEAGAVGDHRLETADAAGEKIAITREVQDHGMAGLGRHVPEDDSLTVRRGQDMLFRLGKAGGIGSGAADGRDRKQHLALADIQHEETGAIDGRENNGDPLDDGHHCTARPRVETRACDGSAAIS